MDTVQNIYCGRIDKSGEETLLFIGAPEAFKAFSELLGSFANPSHKTVDIKTNRLFVLKNIKLSIKRFDHEVGIKKDGDTSFEWRLSPPVAVYFSELLKTLSSSKEPSHQYLESYGHDDVSVVASLGEYDESIFEEGSAFNFVQ